MVTEEGVLEGKRIDRMAFQHIAGSSTVHVLSLPLSTSFFQLTVEIVYQAQRRICFSRERSFVALRNWSLHSKFQPFLYGILPTSNMQSVIGDIQGDL